MQDVLRKSDSKSKSVEIKYPPLTLHDLQDFETVQQSNKSSQPFSKLK